MKTTTSFRQSTRSIVFIATVALAALSVGGCIEHSETTYRSAERVPVKFESEKAGRVFYEALSKMPYHDRAESHTDVSIPVVFEVKTTVRSGENEKFNEAVRQCDTNKDGQITETEADIFAGQFH